MGAQLRLAMSLQRSGKLDQAEPLDQRLLASNPNHVEALHFLGVLTISAAGATKRRSASGGRSRWRRITRPLITIWGTC